MYKVGKKGGGKVRGEQLKTACGEKKNNCVSVVPG